jgi:hypothetical protein
MDAILCLVSSILVRYRFKAAPGMVQKEANEDRMINLHPGTGNVQASRTTRT